MPIHLLDLLREGIEVRPWLERQLVGPDLLDLVRELTVLHGNAAGPDAGAVFQEQHRSEILQRGLAALSEEQLQRLFRNPALLLQLQEWVLVDGGPYWDGVLSGSATLPIAAPSLVPRTSARPRSFRLWPFASHAGVAAAAAALVWLVVAPKPVRDVVEQKVDLAAAPADLLLPTLGRQMDEQLCAARHEQEALTALQEMQTTCATLAEAPLSQLSESARTAVRRDLAWLQKEIESQRRRLEQGAEVWQVRATVESRVHSLVATCWRDPSDLPDLGQDPDDLPPASAF
jgi:hypothetical protein